MLPVFIAPELPDAEGSLVTLSGAEAKHISVRRFGVGDVIELTDGAGVRAQAEIVAVGVEVQCRITGAVLEAAPIPAVTVVQAIPKSDRADLTIDQLVETGADRIIPWAAQHCVAKWEGKKAGKAVEKWRVRSREAAKQARRSFIPPVEEQFSTAQVVELVQEVTERGGAVAVLHEVGSQPFRQFAASAGSVQEVVFIIGPEGGVSENEVAAFGSAGATVVKLGREVLRTALAGAAGLSALGVMTQRW